MFGNGVDVDGELCSQYTLYHTDDIDICRQRTVD